MTPVALLRVVAGIVVAAYAAYQLRRYVPRRDTTEADMRVVLDLAARLRASGRPEAVKLCQQILDELLKAPPPEKTK